ncbi:hypothetical protein FACS1894191_5000 [Clostridia bacterium]|nr:hypothetical protein FACS1894191_5000 [Clostridia bacterium]
MNSERYDNAPVKRVELHLHTKMSAMDAVTDVAEAVHRAIEWGHPAIAITDHGVVQSFPDAMTAAGDKIKILYGMMASLINDTDASSRRKPYHIMIFAKNQTGLKNLYTLVSKSHLEHYDGQPIIPKSLLTEYRAGLIIGAACEAGEIFSLVAEGGGEFEQHRLAEFYDYLEIEPVSGSLYLEKEAALRDINRRIVELGRETGKPVVAVGNVHFLDPAHEIFRNILLTARGNDTAHETPPYYFRTTDEMLEEFAYLGEETAHEVVARNSRLIAGMCETVQPLPPVGKLFALTIDNSAEDLKTLVYSRLRKLYGEAPPKIVTARVETELDFILEHNYDGIFMAAQKLVADSHRNGYSVGSRGSIGASLVAYLAGITETNPLRPHYKCSKCEESTFSATRGYLCGADLPDKICPVCGIPYKKDGFNIPLETFFGIDGDKIPDIQLNFSDEYQAAAYKLTKELFGSDHVFRAGTISTISKKASRAYVEKYLELTGKPATYEEKSHLANGIVGIKRTTGQHPGGLVIIPKDMEITDFCPVQHPANDCESDGITTHFDFRYMASNLIKLNELGHDNPTMIKMMEALTGVNARDIPLDDPETLAIFSSPEPLGLTRGDEIIGETGAIGIPEFGTTFVRQMLYDTRPDSFEALVRLCGFSHGTDVWTGNARGLIFSGTASIYETISCRDDIILDLVSKGIDREFVFKIMESVRKGLGLPLGAREVMAASRVPDWYIESCEKIKYLIPRAHVASYVTTAFRIAWFKVHRPLAFYSAYFFRRRHSFDAKSMTSGIEIVRAGMGELKCLTKRSILDEDILTTLEACYEFYLRGFSFANVGPNGSDEAVFAIAGERELHPPMKAQD